MKAEKTNYMYKILPPDFGITFIDFKKKFTSSFLLEKSNKLGVFIQETFNVNQPGN